MRVMTADLISRARAGDGDAFKELTEPHRRELQVHCYRMLGSFADAEDALQDTLLAAWQGLGGFEERASIRTWLYRIATNRCLNARRAARGDPPGNGTSPGSAARADRLGEVVWLEPYPDALLADVIGAPPGPEARYEQAESISLAFVTALQILPPRQLAVLILRDVLGFHASEVAGMLDATVESVNSALKRARPAAPTASGRRRGAAPTPGYTVGGRDRGPVRQRLRGGRHRRAGGHADRRRLHVDAADAARVPGRNVVGHFCAATLFAAGRRFDLLPTRANGQPAFGAYVRAPTASAMGRPNRDDPGRRPDLRDDPVREQRAAALRPARHRCRADSELPAGGASPSRRSRNSANALSPALSAAAESSARAIIMATSFGGGQHDVGERVHVTVLDPARRGGVREAVPDHPQRALFVEFPPALPAQHRGRVDQHDLPHNRVAGLPDPRQGACPQRGDRVRGVPGDFLALPGDAGADLLQDRPEQRFLAREVVVERARAGLSRRW